MFGSKPVSNNMTMDADYHRWEEKKEEERRKGRETVV
jgi:hypothetical protein